MTNHYDNQSDIIFFFSQFIFRCINVKSGITLLHLSGVMKALDRSVETLGL